MNTLRIGRASAIVATFVVMGPVIGLFTVAICSFFAVGLSNGFDGAWAIPAFLMIYGWLFAHLMGALPALVAGTLIAAYAMRFGRVPLWVGATSGLASALLLSAIGGYGLEFNGEGLSNSAVRAIWLATHIVAATTCTAMTRGWQ